MLKLPDKEMSFWREEYPSDSVYPPLKEDIRVDVAVVGAGITGLTTAYLLKQRGLAVAVVEKDTIGAGTTGRTTGKVTSQHGLYYHRLIDRYGKETAQSYADANQSAVKMVGDVIRKEKIDCDWQEDDNYIFTDSKQNLDHLKREAQAAEKLGLPSTFVKDSPLPFPIKGAVKFSQQGKFHSIKYLLGLAKVVNGSGSYVFEKTRSKSFQDGELCIVRTSRGSITSSSIIVATHIPTFPLIGRVGYAAFEHPTESFAVAATLPTKYSGMFISPDKNHHSILPITIGNKNVLLIVGAGGNIPGFAWNKTARYERLASYAQERFNVQSISHYWSDMDYIAYDNLPLVGKLYFWSKNMYTATGFHKWGLSGGTAASVILADQITNKKNDWSHTFNSSRLRPVWSIPRAIIEYVSGNRR